MINNPILLLLLLILTLTACSSPTAKRLPAPAQPTQDLDLTGVGGVTPRFEPPSRIGNKDYQVFGRDYKVWNGIEHYQEEGTAPGMDPAFMVSTPPMANSITRKMSRPHTRTCRCLPI